MSVSTVPAPAPAAPAAAPQTAAPAAASTPAATSAPTPTAGTPTTTAEAAPEPAKPAFDWNTWSFDYEGDVPEEHRSAAERLRGLHQERLSTAQQELERQQAIAKFWQSAAGGGDEDVDILGIQQEAQELRDAKARGEITERELREEMQKLNSELEELRGIRDSFENQIQDHVSLMAQHKADQLWGEMEGPATQFLEGSVEGDAKHRFYDALVESIDENFPLELIGPIFSLDEPSRGEFMELFQEGMRADKAFARAQKGAQAREKAAQEKVDTVLTGPSNRGSVPLRGGANPQEARPRQRASLLSQRFS
jgi:hypothetical protein